MNKIKILNKEFELWDMVEVKIRYSYKYSNKFVGHLTGKLQDDVSGRYYIKVKISDEEVNMLEDFLWEDEIVSINKLVYEQ